MVEGPQRDAAGASGGIDEIREEDIDDYTQVIGTARQEFGTAPALAMPCTGNALLAAHTNAGRPGAKDSKNNKRELQGNFERIGAVTEPGVAFVHTPAPMGKARMIPKAIAAVDKEWDDLIVGSKRTGPAFDLRRYNHVKKTLLTSKRVGRKHILQQSLIYAVKRSWRP